MGSPVEQSKAAKAGEPCETPRFSLSSTIWISLCSRRSSPTGGVKCRVRALKFGRRPRVAAFRNKTESFTAPAKVVQHRAVLGVHFEQPAQLAADEPPSMRCVTTSRLQPLSSM
jgi:hypothetical protein